jgi:hypothetical protein
MKNTIFTGDLAFESTNKRCAETTFLKQKSVSEQAILSYISALFAVTTRVSSLKPETRASFLTSLFRSSSRTAMMGDVIYVYSTRLFVQRVLQGWLLVGRIREHVCRVTTHLTLPRGVRNSRCRLLSGE